MEEGTDAGERAWEPVPAGWRMIPDRALRRFEGDATLVGGVPLRVFRLGPRAAAHAGGWLRGEPVADRSRARALARRLLDAGIAHPLPTARPGGEVTIVIPARDRVDALARCLGALGTAHPVIVVDDGSVDPGAVARVAARAGAGLVRRAENGGPAAARNTGRASCATPFVAFLDSDCVPPRDWVERLLPHLADPVVAIAAPRIVAAGSAARHGLAAYERARSALDMGPDPGAVRPGAQVPYVPATALVARVEALGDGFDPSMRVGEDVDLAWRLAAEGWTIRYDPEVEVPHDHRVRVVPWLRTRVTYNEATADLALRHPGALHAAYVSRWSLAAWCALAVGRPALASGLATVSGVLLHRRLGSSVPAPGRLAAEIAARGMLRDGLDLARAVRAPWLPPVLLACVASRRARRAAALSLVAAPLVDARLRGSPLDPVTEVVGRIADDAARGAGIWRGCLRHRTLAPLLPGVGVGSRRGAAGPHAGRIA